MHRKRKILINCLDVIGESMAGPAIRSWEFATQLSKNYNVVVLSPNKTELKSKYFELKQYSMKTFEEEIKNADILISQTIRQKMAKLAKKYNTRIILDAYDPITIEALEANSHDKFEARKAVNKILLMEQSSSFFFADSVICASEKQRDFWLGVLSSMNKINPAVYDKDNSLRNIIDVVPFGLSSTPPLISGSHILRKKFGLKSTDFVLLWGGGIWNWFDPMSLIEAVAEISKKLPVKLVFMGIDHPNKNIPRMPMVNKAIEKAKELGVLDESVFFNEGWVPYKQRQEFLLDADAGVSMHYDHLETRFSFRTRILDYIWASLPIIATQGDSFAEIIEVQNLGEVVEYRESKSISTAIEKLIVNKGYYKQTKKNLTLAQKDFYWEECTKPIENMVEYWAKNKPEKKVSINQAMLSISGLYGGQVVQAKKLLNKYFGIRSNISRLGNIYRSQNIIRRSNVNRIMRIKK
jgi:glycosyltransferase involved in cell wall biosynthesis